MDKLKSTAYWFFRFYVYVNVHVALAVVSVYYISSRLLGIVFKPETAVFLFSISMSAYTLMRYISLSYHRKEIRKFYHKYCSVILFLIINLGIAVYFFMKFNLQQKIFFVIPLVLTVFYDLFPGYRWLAWREVEYLKVFLVAAVWVMLTVIFPQLPDLNERTVLVSALVFVWILILIIPFDIRDLGLDSFQLRTLPQIFERYTIWPAVILGAIFFVLVFKIHPEHDVLQSIILLSGAVSVLAVYGARKYGQNFYYSTFWVEGIPVVTALAISLFCR